MGDRVLLVVAYDDSIDTHEPVAGALNMIGSDALFGRNWCVHIASHHPVLLSMISFSVCMCSVSGWSRIFSYNRNVITAGDPPKGSLRQSAHDLETFTFIRMAQRHHNEHVSFWVV